MKNGFSRTLHTFRNIQKLSKLPPIDFLRVNAFLRGGGRSAPPPNPGLNRVNSLQCDMRFFRGSSTFKQKSLGDGPAFFVIVWN